VDSGDPERREKEEILKRRTFQLWGIPKNVELVLNEWLFLITSEIWNKRINNFISLLKMWICPVCRSVKMLSGFDFQQLQIVRKDLIPSPSNIALN
jgi:hypothetical protein